MGEILIPLPPFGASVFQSNPAGFHGRPLFESAPAFEHWIDRSDPSLTPRCGTSEQASGLSGLLQNAAFNEMIRSGDRQFRLLNHVVSIPKNLKMSRLELFDGCHRQICECSYVSDHIQQDGPIPRPAEVWHIG